MLSTCKTENRLVVDSEGVQFTRCFGKNPLNPRSDFRVQCSPKVPSVPDQALCHIRLAGTPRGYGVRHWTLFGRQNIFHNVSQCVRRLRTGSMTAVQSLLFRPRRYPWVQGFPELARGVRSSVADLTD